MTNKIEKLTPEQEAYLPIFRDEWLKIGLSTQRVDREASTAAVKRLYAAGGRAEPLVMHFDSPMQCILAIHIMRGLGEIKEQDLMADLWDNLWANLKANLRANLRADLRADLGANLRADLWANLWANLWDNLRDDLGDSLGANLRDSLWDNLRDNLRDNLGDNLGADLWDNLWDNLRDNLRDNFWDNLWDNLWDSLGDSLGDSQKYISTYFWGGMDAYWIAWAKFAEEIGVPIEKKEHFDAYVGFVKTSGVSYFYPGLAFVSDRPDFIGKDEQMRLHCETGPALSFTDGYAVHAWHGTNVPAKWVEETSSVDPVDVLKTENVEQRAAGVAILGMEKMLDRLDHKIVDSDPDPERGDLIKVSLPDLPNPGYYLRALCPRNGRIMEAVNANELDEMTVRGAQAWRLGIPAKEFVYPERRT